MLGASSGVRSPARVNVTPTTPEITSPFKSCQARPEGKPRAPRRWNNVEFFVDPYTDTLLALAPRDRKQVQDGVEPRQIIISQQTGHTARRVDQQEPRVFSVLRDKR